MYIDIKETVWTRYYVRDKNEQEIKEALEKGEYPWEFSEDVESETLFDTSEVMTVEENYGDNTIEFYNEGDLIYQNGK